MTRPARRSGYTLLELMCVIAVLVILGAVILPSLAGMFLDTRVKAAADLVRGQAAIARSRAIEDGRVYQLFASPDGRRVRIGPDESELLEQSASATATPILVRETDLPDGVTLVPMFTGDETQMTVSTDGWTKLVSFKPDGTCRELLARFELQEPGVQSFMVTVRGITGAVVVNPSAEPGQAAQTPQISGGNVP